MKININFVYDGLRIKPVPSPKLKHSKFRFLTPEKSPLIIPLQIRVSNQLNDCSSISPSLLSIIFVYGNDIIFYFINRTRKQQIIIKSTNLAK